MTDEDARKLYPEVDPRDLEPFYWMHMNALTAARLESKSAIAEQLAWRDQTIASAREEQTAIECAILRSDWDVDPSPAVCIEKMALEIERLRQELGLGQVKPERPLYCFRVTLDSVVYWVAAHDDSEIYPLIEEADGEIDLEAVDSRRIELLSPEALKRQGEVPFDDGYREVSELFAQCTTPECFAAESF